MAAHFLTGFAEGAMPKRTNPRLAYCEYVLPSPDQSIATEMVRSDLMRAVFRVHRTMLEKLSETVFPAYCELAQSGFDFDAILWHPRVAPSTQIPNGKLKAALQQWASEFHVEESWLLDDALRTLRGWYVALDCGESPRWNPIGRVTPTIAVGAPFCFTCEGWEMQLLAWTDYSRSLRERFDQRLAEYEAECRKLAESRGLVRVPHKFSMANIDWFVLYQFAGLSSKEIGDQNITEKSSDESTVLKGVKAAAKLLGWGRLRTARTNRKNG